jgi:hypothetical protein
MAISMEMLDDLVVTHLEDRLLLPERLETTLAAVLDDPALKHRIDASRR